MFRKLRHPFSFAGQAASRGAADWKREGNERLAAGQLDQAVECYRRAVAAAPTDVHALLNLGFSLLEQQQAHGAAEVLTRALRIDPRHHEAHYVLGNAYRALGDLDSAAQSYSKAIEFEPDFSEARLQLGRLCMEQGDVVQAARHFAQVAQSRPSDPLAQVEAGTAWGILGRLAEAENCFRRALALTPGHADAWLGLGNVLMSGGSHDQAVDCYVRVLALIPGQLTATRRLGEALAAVGRNAEAVERLICAAQAQPDAGAWMAVARCQFALGQHASAASSCQRALEIQPDHLPALQGRAECMLALNRHADAVDAYERVLVLVPDSPEAHLNHGNALLALGREEQALASYSRALRARPCYADALVNIAAALQTLGRYEEAIHYCEQVIQLDASNAEAHWNLALCRLTLGQLPAGWREAEWRWRARFHGGLQKRVQYPAPRWDGQALAGKTILVHSEQGLGDALQFCRYVPELAARGARVVLSVPPQLAPLLSQLPGVARMISDGEPLPALDLECPLLSLPAGFQTALETIPRIVPYVRCSEAGADAWARRLGPREDLRVGLVWSGNPGHVNDRNRSIPVVDLASIAMDGVQLVSLQKELRPGDQGSIESLPIDHYGELLTDFTDTAALVQCMDLVISVDTSVAHLAGAMGRPLWVLLPFCPDWRWLLAREDSPWYPTARLFRQPRPHDWASVLLAVKTELAMLRSLRGPASI